MAEGKEAVAVCQGVPFDGVVFSTLRPGEPRVHPTEKPTELFAIPMRQHTKRGDVCFEPFSGSGTQIVAAEKLARVCYAMELWPALERLSLLGLHPGLCK